MKRGLLVVMVGVTLALGVQNYVAAGTGNKTYLKIYVETPDTISSEFLGQLRENEAGNVDVTTELSRGAFSRPSILLSLYCCPMACKLL
jgi:hypothetical protein